MSKYSIKIGLFIVFVLFLSVKVRSENFSSYTQKHQEVVLREIGHLLLLHAKDSTSRVLPIKKLGESIFQIEFQSQFTFISDTLINLVHRRFQETNLPASYIVSVLNCINKAVIFGYEVSPKTGNVIPCTGRIQPKGCYIIQIEFLPKPEQNKLAYLLLLIPFAFISYLLGFKYFKKKKDTNTDNQEFTSIGSLKLYAHLNLLKFENTSINLYDKELKLLQILFENKNQTIERELLMKEIWEDQGVIVVGRSLDVLVSKLRKKLELDADIKLINVHGIGYKLIV